MKQITKIVGICLAMSLSMATSSVFAMKQGDHGRVAKKHWIKKVSATPAGKALAITVPVCVCAYLLNYIWTAASAYCAGDVNIVGQTVLCPVVSHLDWMYAGLASIVAPYLTQLWESAVEFMHIEGGISAEQANGSTDDGRIPLKRFIIESFGGSEENDIVHNIEGASHAVDTEGDGMNPTERYFRGAVGFPCVYGDGGGIGTFTCQDVDYYGTPKLVCYCNQD